jgi:hypothetical protein
MNIEEEIKGIKERNAKVEVDKACLPADRQGR